MKKRRIPHTYVIVFYVIIIAAILTWIVPGGEYRKTTSTVNGIEQETLEYIKAENQAQTWQLFSAFYKGFVRQAGIIIFILLIGGAFWIMNASKAIDLGIMAFLRFTKKLEKRRFFKILGVDNIIITLIMLLFSLFGAVFGMSEETIAFIIIMVPLAISMGYDSITGASMCFVAASLGFAGALLNPFTIGIAQGIAGLPLFSGLEYRFICWIIINIIGISFVLRYAAGLRRKPERSPVYHEDNYWRDKSNAAESVAPLPVSISAKISYLIISAGLLVFSVAYPVSSLSIGASGGESSSGAGLPLIPVLSALFIITGFLTLRKSLWQYILNMLVFTILFLIVGVMGYGWYIMEIATLFFVMGIFSGIAMNCSPNRITALFLEGARDILSAALIVGLAGGIIVVLEEGKIIDTLLYYASAGMKDLGETASIGVMYVIQTLINIFIPSGSAKAAITMPIMAPFSDLIGISRQATVMAFQFGDGFTNMITPTSGVLIGVLGVAKIPYEKWVKWIAPLMIILIITGFLLLIPTVKLGLNGF